MFQHEREQSLEIKSKLKSPVTCCVLVPQHVWDELDAWYNRLMLLENEVQDLAQDHPDHAHLLMDHLTRPLQLYQHAAQMAEQRTAFLSKARQSVTFLLWYAVI